MSFGAVLHQITETPGCVLGTVSSRLVGRILEVVRLSRTISPRDKCLIIQSLTPLCGTS